MRSGLRNAFYSLCFCGSVSSRRFLTFGLWEIKWNLTCRGPLDRLNLGLLDEKLRLATIDVGFQQAYFQFKCHQEDFYEYNSRSLQAYSLGTSPQSSQVTAT
jgi:hypothetical protein